METERSLNIADKENDKTGYRIFCGDPVVIYKACLSKGMSRSYASILILITTFTAGAGAFSIHLGLCASPGYRRRN